jgi:hypothetical protein
MRPASKPSASALAVNPDGRLEVDVHQGFVGSGRQGDGLVGQIVVVLEGGEDPLQGDLALGERTGRLDAGGHEVAGHGAGGKFEADRDLVLGPGAGL